MGHGVDEVAKEVSGGPLRWAPGGAAGAGFGRRESFARVAHTHGFEQPVDLGGAAVR